MISLLSGTLLNVNLEDFNSFLTFLKSFIRVSDVLSKNSLTPVLIAQTMIAGITIAVIGNIRVAALTVAKAVAVEAAPIGIPEVTSENLSNFDNRVDNVFSLDSRFFICF